MLANSGRLTSGAGVPVVKPEFNPLRAKPGFQLWYPGGQRLKVISFS